MAQSSISIPATQPVPAITPSPVFIKHEDPSAAFAEIEPELAAIDAADTIRVDVRRAVGVGRGSGFRIVARTIADTRNETASTAIAIGAVRT